MASLQLNRCTLFPFVTIKMGWKIIFIISNLTYIVLSVQLLYLLALKQPLLLQQALNNGTASGLFQVSADVVDAAVSAWKEKDLEASKRAAEAAACGAATVA
jgi:hypothetical protein